MKKKSYKCGVLALSLCLFVHVSAVNVIMDDRSSSDYGSDGYDGTSENSIMYDLSTVGPNWLFVGGDKFCHCSPQFGRKLTGSTLRQR